MKKILFIIFIIAFLFIPITNYLKSRTRSQSEITSYSSITNTAKSVSMEIVAQGLEVPWSIVFTSPNRILITERPGSIRIIENNNLLVKPLISFPEVSSQDEEGLMGLTLDPDYDKNHYLYTSYAYPKGNNLVVKVVRLIDRGNSARVDRILIDNIPAAQFHAGSRIKFGPDNKLYITTGDATDKNLAQDTSSLAGKILRINSDGTIPGDNPFPESPVFTYGHRNSQGLDWYPNSEILYATEHGPSGFDGPPGGDEINVIVKGKNYGWSLVSHEQNRIGLESPKLVFTPAIAPSAGLFYTGGMFPEYKNNFLFTQLKGEGIIRVIVNENDPTKIERFEEIPNINVGRIREIVQGEDGSIYFSTSNRDGRGDIREGDDKIYRLTKK